ncbi:MAG: 50S ribosomal protein L9 [Selenomonadaceae bacterium]|nr:50S ribosomal protein L9 [Selenomonadaceae bacterium]MBQ3727425.1 50S ribosomal protein L9 [Selenomonadaceae bacterium]MBQ9497431.1 50S ribosomal protein L9 [Selenomonadaceae bacterium]
MKVILQEDVKKVGAKGEVVEVSDGYGRNYLLPRKLAVEASVANLNTAKVKAENKARKARQEADEAKLLGAQLEKISVKIPVRLGKDGKLFGSVGGSDVAKALKENHSLNVDKRKISIAGEVTGVGVYDAVIKLHPEVATKIKIEVVEG